MRKLGFITALVVVAAAAIALDRWTSRRPPANTAGSAGADSGRGSRRGGEGGSGGGFQGGGFGGFGGFPGGRGNQGPRGSLTVEVARVSRASMAQNITVVGNLIGEATVAVAPRAAGRLVEVDVRLGDRVTRGQRIAKIEDFEIVEQVKQAEAAQEVSMATIRQREADLRLAETNVARSRNLFERQLLPKQTLDDNEARYQAAVAQIDLARAQNTQSRARLDELRINLANTVIVSPVTGFVARRAVDPGAFVSQNAPIVDVVDISRVRLVVNVVEKDLKELQSGDVARVEVDAFPGEEFRGRIARVAPVLDPATRTAPIEIEIPNGDFRLKPGMYARVSITTDIRKDTLVVPANAVVDLGGRRGIFQPLNGQAVFRTVQVGSEQQNVVEVLGGLAEGDEVITTGAGALRDGDRFLLAGADGERGGRRGRTASAGPGSGAAGREGGRPAAQGDVAGRASGDNGGGRRGGRPGRDVGGPTSPRFGGDPGARPGRDGGERPSGGRREGRAGAEQPVSP
jgi:HlyD family secretion protein